MNRIQLDDLHPALREDLDAPSVEFTFWEDPMMDGDFVDGNRRYQIAHHAEAYRGGIVLVGSGSSGIAVWTDAATPEEVLERYLADEMTV